MFLKQATNSQVVQTPSFVSDTDFKTVQTGLTIANTDVKLIQGGSSTNKNSGGGTHVVNGTYSLTLNSTDTGTVGRMLISISVSGALPVFFYVYVLEEAVYDALFAASAPGYGTAQTGDSYAIVNSGTYGNSALKSLIDAVDNFVDTEVAALQTDLTTVLSRLGTPSNLGGGASVAANLADIEGQTDDLGTAGAGLTAVPWNAAWDAEVQSEVQDALEANNLDHLVKIAVDTDFATTVHLNSVIGHLADNGSSATFDRTTDSLEALQAEHDATQALVAASAIRAAVGLASANLDTQLGAIDDYIDTELAAVASNVSAVKTVTDRLDDTLEDDGGTYRFTINALEQAPSGGGGGDTDWTADERTAIRTILGIPSSGTTPEVPSAGALKVIDDLIDTEIGTISSNVSAILADTNELQTDWANGGRLDLILDARASQTSVDAVDDFLDTEMAAVLLATGTTIPAALSALFTTARPESYRSAGATGTIDQLLYEAIAHLGESSIAGTTKTLKKLDGSTTAKTYTLNDATNPTAVSETT